MVGQRNIFEGLQKSEYRPSELHNISVVVDPLPPWWTGREQGILHRGRRTMGGIVSEGSEAINRNGETIIGTAYTLRATKASVTVWDSNGYY